MKVNIKDVIIGERRRGEQGDIQGLAESISKYGLLHPIVVDDSQKGKIEIFIIPDRN